MANPPLRSRIRSFVRRARPTGRGLLIANTVVWVAIAVLWHRCGIAGCPTVESLASYQPDGASVLLDRNGEQFADLAPVNHELVSLSELPSYVPAAFIAIEDKRFYRHTGVDLRRVVGAAIVDIQERRFAQGFSTITMQLARNVWPETLPGARRNVKRKILEIRVAREVERKFEKDEILELYLNHIYFGSGAYGIGAAARNFFGKSAYELTLAEASLLAAIPRSPVLYNPRRYRARSEARRDLVIRLMERQSLIDAAAAERARADSVHVLRDPPTAVAGATFAAPFFVEAVRRVLEERLGEDLYTARLVIHTTLEPRTQQIAEEELERQLGVLDQSRPPADSGRGPQALEGALVVMAVDSGDVHALVGGRDHARSRYDRATRARRRSANVFAPFIVAAALDEGYSASQYIADTPAPLEFTDAVKWMPDTARHSFEGAVTLRDALVMSKDVPTVRLAADLGMNNVTRTLHRFGVRTEVPNAPHEAVMSAAFTPLELATAYTAFAGGGRAVLPRLVTRVVGADGVVVWESPVVTRTALDPAVAYIVTDMLEEAVTRGAAQGVRRAGFGSAAAGMAGTTTERNDAWMVGYTPDLVASIWIGFDTPKPIMATAPSVEPAAPVWGRLMNRIYEERRTPAEWVRPENVVELPIDPASGLALGPGCTATNAEDRKELFIRGAEPAATCPSGEVALPVRNLKTRAGGWLARVWHRSTYWLARHVGSEERRARTPSDERYLGVPRLPRAIDLPVPVVSADSFVPPPFDSSAVTPEDSVQ